MDTLISSAFWLFVLCISSRANASEQYTFNSGIQPDVSFSSDFSPAPYKNRHPVIGILAQEDDPMRHAGKSYIYEAYAKFIEQAGALVVPVRVNKPDEYYQTLFKKLNGVVFPGGGVSLITSGYAKSAQHFFNMSKQAFARGDQFPILGICLGFQELTALVIGEDRLVPCDGENQSEPLNFTAEAKSSRMFQDIPDDLYAALTKWKLTFNNHQYCMSTKVFRENRKLTDFYKVLSTNVGADGVEFVSTVEANDYPFYGTQWHPAKNIYLWSDANVNHSAIAVQVTQYIADFFVNQARQSIHHFDSLDDLATSVISNYQSEFQGAPSFHSIYRFDIEPGVHDELDLWDWSKFSTFKEVGRVQFLNLILFLLMLVILLGAVSSVVKYRGATSYRILDQQDNITLQSHS